MFLLSFKDGNDDPTRVSFDACYMQLVEIKDFNALIKNKALSDQPVKSNKEVYEILFVLLRNKDYTTGNLLDYLYHQSIINVLA